jgi:ferredoxin
MSPVRVTIDTDACQGHALCAWTAPEVFEPDEDDGHARLLLSVIPADLEESARRAAAGCPEGAISVSEE